MQEATSVGSFVRLMQLKGGKAELVEVTLAENSPAANRAISELVLPRSATIVAIVRAERVMVPTNDTVLRVGDEVMALITEDAEAERHVGQRQHVQVFEAFTETLCDKVFFRW
ncbi:MAG: hypothetical protein EB104_06065 [Acidimicrobiia bacterium]|nr:hypothetical protein [Acidimicrobiia bacterium]